MSPPKEKLEEALARYEAQSRREVRYALATIILIIAASVVAALFFLFYKPSVKGETRDSRNAPELAR